MRPKQEKLSVQVTNALLGVSAAGFVTGAAALSLTVTDPPRIGDIIAFEATPKVTPGSGQRIVVHRPGAFGCVLDLATIRQTGGSLVIEAQMAPEGSSYRLHWAGERTTADSGNCGASADLIVGWRDLEVLEAEAADNDLLSRQVPNAFNPALPHSIGR